MDWRRYDRLTPTTMRELAAMGAPGLKPRYYAAAATVHDAEQQHPRADEQLASLAQDYAKAHGVGYAAALAAVARECPSLVELYNRERHQHRGRPGS